MINLPHYKAIEPNYKHSADKDVLFHCSTLSPQFPNQKKLYHILKFTDSPFYQWSECAPEDRKNPLSQVRMNLFRGKLSFIFLPILL